MISSVVLAPAAQARFEVRIGRRQDEDRHRVGEPRPHLGRALHVEVEQEVHPVALGPLVLGQDGAVELAVDLRPLQERALLLQGLEGGRVHEVVVDAVRLPRPRAGASCARRRSGGPAPRAARG